MARSKKKIYKQLDTDVHTLEELESAIIKSCSENRLHAHEDGNALVLTSLEDYKKGEPCVVNIQGKEQLLIPHEMFFKILELLHASYEERFCMQLEREIARQMPRDFDDIWEVAVHEIKKSKRGLLNIDPEWLVAGIKKQHPNLFARFEFDF